MNITFNHITGIPIGAVGNLCITYQIHIKCMGIYSTNNKVVRGTRQTCQKKTNKTVKDKHRCTLHNKNKARHVKFEDTNLLEY